MLKKLLGIFYVTPIIFLSLASSAVAEGGAKPWQMDFRPPGSPTMEKIMAFHDLLLWIITIITLFVLALLLYVAVKFNEKSNPVPSKTTHNSVLEVLWTAIPILILVVIAVPSFKLLYFMDRTDKPEMTLKITGHQWYWNYAYPDHGNFQFDSNLVDKNDLKKGQFRLLAVDNEVVVPIKTNIRLLMTSNDVIHAWALPAVVHKTDTVPGRINESWMSINEEGMYYGQCSELCGVNHGYMPIVVRAVSKEKFNAWVKTAKKKFANIDEDNVQKVARANQSGQ